MRRSKYDVYSITSSARASRVGGIARPSALAVLRLMASSYLVAACTGRSLGFAPRRMRAVIAQMRCPSLRFEPRAKKSCRPLLEQFRPRVRNEAIAVWHLHARKRLRVENHCFVDNIAFRKDESYHRINLIGV